MYYLRTVSASHILVNAVYRTISHMQRDNQYIFPYHLTQALYWSVKKYHDFNFILMLNLKIISSI